MNIQHTDYEYEYKGYQYRTWKDYEEDNIKTFHECWKDGKEVKMPRDFYNHSPYSLIFYEEFKQYIDERVLVDFVESKV